MATGHAGLVALTVDLHVLDVTLAESLHGLLNGLHATLLTHGLGGDVAVKTGTVPLAGNGLRVEGNTGTELFGDTVKKETGHPELVTNYICCQYMVHVERFFLGVTHAQYHCRDRLGIPTERA